MVGYRIDAVKIHKFINWVQQNVFNNKLEKHGNEAIKYEVITFENGVFSLDVRFSQHERTVWLTQNDLAVLFETSKQNNSFHIQNIFLEEELDSSVVKYFFTTASDGKRYRFSNYLNGGFVALS